MIIIVTASEEYFLKIKDCNIFGKDLIADTGFIHASSIRQFPLIIPRLEKQGGRFMVLFIDTDKLTSDVKWEYSKSLNQKFPHIYGEINKSAVIKAIKLKDYKNTQEKGFYSCRN